MAAFGEKSSHISHISQRLKADSSRQNELRLEVLKALKKKGFYATRQSGSHIIVENGEGLWTSIPRKTELGKGGNHD